MSPFTIRAGRADDYVRLANLEARSDETYLTLPGFEDLADQPNVTANTGPGDWPGTLVFIADADAPIGFAYAHDLDDCTYLSQLSVVPEAQGRGTGTALLERLVDAARSANRRGVVLATFVEVPWNAPFYIRRGFHSLSDDELGPALRAHAADDARRRSRYGPRCAMGLFF